MVLFVRITLYDPHYVINNCTAYVIFKSAGMMLLMSAASISIVHCSSLFVLLYFRAVVFLFADFMDFLLMLF